MIDEPKKENEEDEKSEGEGGLKEVRGDEFALCEKERDEYLDGWKRAKADLANYKKDEAKRFAEVVRFSQEILVKELIAVLDSFDLALISEEVKSDSKTEKGLFLIQQQLEDILKKNGLERVIVAPGDQFNPAIAEAIAEMESGKPSGSIIEEVEKGYMLHEKLIRPARVKVSK